MTATPDPDVDLRGDALDGVSLWLNRDPWALRDVLGPGNRFVIWTQGCGIGCVGCESRDTWPSGGTRCRVGEIIEQIAEHHGALDGLTISGGEPSEQADGVEALLSALSCVVDRERFDVLLYTGHRLSRLRRDHPRLVGMVDVVVDGPYRQDLPTSLPWRGSANQRLHRLTRLGEERFVDADRPTQRPALAYRFDTDGGFETAGIPEPGQLERLERALVEHGVEIRGRSWRNEDHPRHRHGTTRLGGAS